MTDRQAEHATRASRTAVALLLTLGLAACGGDGGGTGPGQLDIVTNTGLGQAACVGGELDAEMTVKVVNQNSQLVENAAVSWSLGQTAGSGAQLLSADARTDVRGEAGALLQVGDAAGDYEVVAELDNGESVTFTAAALPGRTVDPAVGGDARLVGPSEVGCVQLPSTAGSEEYEVVATPLASTLGFNNMSLFVNGAAAAGLASARGGAGAGTPEGSIRGGHASLPLEDAPGWRAPQAAWDLRMRRLEQRIRPMIRASVAGEPSMSSTAAGGPAAVPNEGDGTFFKTSCRSSTLPDSIPATAVSVGSAGAIYEGDNVTTGFSDASYDSIAATFDTINFATDTTYFGAPGDIDGNGRIILFFTEIVNELTTGSYDDGFVAGYFCPADLLDPSQTSQKTNFAEMFYLVVPDPNGNLNGGGGSLTEEEVRSVVQGVVAHEFQHLINAQVGGGGAQDVWINEGLSHLAEEVNGHAATGNQPGQELTAADLTADQDAFDQYYVANLANLGTYLAEPHADIGLLASTDPGVPNTFRMRGAAWSFVRYLLDRFESPSTEQQLTRDLILNSASLSRDAVSQVTGTSFDELVVDWAGMLAVEDRGISSLRSGLTLPSYQLREVYVTLTGSNTYPLENAVVTADLGSDTSVPADLFTGTGRYLRLTGPGSTENTGLRLAEPFGGQIDPGIAPNLLLVRTK